MKPFTSFVRALYSCRLGYNNPTIIHLLTEDHKEIYIIKDQHRAYGINHKPISKKHYLHCKITNKTNVEDYFNKQNINRLIIPK